MIYYMYIYKTQFPNQVMFDLTAFPGPVTIGIAKRNPDYKLASKHEYVSKLAAEKRPAQVRFWIQAQLLRRNVKRFRGGLVFKANRLLHHSTVGSRVIKKKKKKFGSAVQGSVEYASA